MLPFVGSTPLQASEAAQEVAFVELQLRVEALPVETVLGEALNDTDGGATVAALDPPPPQAASVSDVPTLRPTAATRAKCACQQRLALCRGASRSSCKTVCIMNAILFEERF